MLFTILLGSTFHGIWQALPFDILKDVGENGKLKYTILSESFSKLLQKWEF
jgi:hypothetical protein